MESKCLFVPIAVDKDDTTFGEVPLSYNPVKRLYSQGPRTRPFPIKHQNLILVETVYQI